MNKDGNVPMKGQDEVKMWMEAHPQEYAQFSSQMSDQGINGILKLGEEAFRHSPAFQKEVERMVDTERLKYSDLVDFLLKTNFTADYFREKNDDKMAMAAWIKYGESPELILKELDNAVVAQGKRKYRNLLVKLSRLFCGKFFYRKNLPDREYYYQRHQAPSDSSFQTLLASHDESL